MAYTLVEFLAKAEERDANPDLRNLCAAGCGHEHSGADPIRPVMIPGVGLVCADCLTDAISDMVDTHPIGRPMATIAH